MAWELNDREFEAVGGLPATERYEYFVKRAAGRGQLWGLRGAGGWVIAEDDEGCPYVPVWPHQRWAQALAQGPWSDAEPVVIDVDEWVEAWLPDLGRDGLRVAVFQTVDDRGVGVSPQRLKHDLEAELERFGL